jgi:hypothetical protein
MFEFSQAAEIKVEMYNWAVCTGHKEHTEGTVSGLTENTTRHENKGQTCKRRTETQSVFPVKKT